MKRPHCRNKSDQVILGASLPRRLFHPMNCANNFHGVSCSTLRARGCRAFAVEMHQVRQDWFCAVLPNHRGDLSAMIGSVICEMLQRLPERVRVDAKVKSFVFENAVKICLRQTGYKVE